MDTRDSPGRSRFRRLSEIPPENTANASIFSKRVNCIKNRTATLVAQSHQMAFSLAWEAGLKKPNTALHLFYEINELHLTALSGLQILNQHNAH
jgi:hypothetical protein